MKDRIFYLGFYNNEIISSENREFFPAADTKMEYVRSVLGGLANKVHIISPSRTKCNHYVQGNVSVLDDKTDLKTFNSFGEGSKIKRFLGRYFIKIQLMLYLLSSISNRDILVVYHSLSYMKIISWAKKIKKFKVIEEIEEIYADVTNNRKIRSKEFEFFQIADGYVFSTELLNKEINISNKPYAVANGTYKAEPLLCNKFDDGNIHVVYAGTLDHRKGGAISAVTSARFLPSKYHIHILGFGSNEQKEMLVKSIKDNSVDGHAKVTYDGLLVGDDYKRFIQSCHIGLSTQNPDASFNATSFPSKILAYMANGLKVVSIRIPAIEESAVGNYVYFYDRQKPEEIAEVIKSISFDDNYDSRNLLNKLHLNFAGSFLDIVDVL